MQSDGSFKTSGNAGKTGHNPSEILKGCNYMKTRNWMGCVWSVERYTVNNPELFYKERIKMTCIESHCDAFNVGAVVDVAASGLIDRLSN